MAHTQAVRGIAVSMVALVAGIGWGQELEDREQRLVWMSEMAAEYDFYLDSQPGERLRLQSQPVFRWTNPIRNSTDGAVFVWTARGRPQVMVGVFTRGKGIYQHEFQSLALEGLIAEVGQQVVWAPRKSGVEFRPVPDSPVPAESAAARLRQMKAIARQFISSLHVRGEPARQLRLLPHPVYRYAVNDAAPADGALFVFSMGTDPESMLLLETSSDAVSRWVYAFARMTWAPVAAQHQSQPVWKVGYWNRVADKSRPYIVFKDQKAKGL